MPGRKVGRVLMGRLMPRSDNSGPNPIEALESGRLTGCLKPKVPTITTLI